MATWGLFQATSTFNAGVVGTTGISVAFGTNPTPGNVIVAASLTTIATGLTPTFSDTYLSPITTGAFATVGSLSMAIYAGVVAQGTGTDTVKVTWNSGANNYINLAIGEFTKPAGTLAFDTSGTATPSQSGGTFHGPTLVTAGADDLAIQYCSPNGTGANVSPWNLMVVVDGNPTGYQGNITPGSYQTSFTDTLTGTDDIIAVAFKLLGGTVLHRRMLTGVGQ